MALSFRLSIKKNSHIIEFKKFTLQEQHQIFLSRKILVITHVGSPCVVQLTATSWVLNYKWDLIYT